MKTGWGSSKIIALVMLCSVGCHAQLQSDHQAPAGAIHNTIDMPSPQTSLSTTVLNFGLYNCRSTLHDINRAIDKLTVRTQPNYWASLKQRYSRSKAQYAQLHGDWSKAAGRNDTPEHTTIQRKLDALEAMLLDTGKRMEHRDGEYTQARRQYELSKMQDFADLQRGEPTAERFHVDADLILGLSAVEVTLSHVLVTLEAYTTGSVAAEEQDVSTERAGLSTAQGLEDDVSLIDEENLLLGPPEELQYDRLPSLDGIIMTLAFARELTEEGAPLRLRIDPSPLGNIEPIILAIDPVQEQARVVRAMEEECRHVATPTTESADSGVIHCQKVSGLLMVPVRASVHGVEVETHMILDTGASMTVLSKSVYHRGLGRPLSELDNLSMGTANGQMTCPVDTLQVSTEAFAKEMTVALTDDSKSLLGMDYWAGRRFTIDLDKACVYVHPKLP